MSDLMNTEFLPHEDEIRITVEFTGAVGYYVNGVVPHDDLHVRAARAGAKMAQIGIAPQDRPGFARDLLTRLSLIPPAQETEAEACVDLALWVAGQEGVLDGLAPGEANWLRLSWSAMMDADGDAPHATLDHCPAQAALWHAAA